MKAIRIADLKAHLSQHLRTVRRGHSLTVLDRETPVARIIPYQAEKPETLQIARRSATAPATGRVPLPPPLALGHDVVQFLLEERQGDR